MQFEQILPGKDGKKPVLIINTGGANGLTRKGLVTKISELSKLPFGVNLHDFRDVLTPSNIEPNHWIEIGKLIKSGYEDHQGFVVIHDLDIMSYTAAALSFILEHLNKPVVLTGFSCAASRPYDVSGNLSMSLKIAAPESTGFHLVPEVCIFFKGVLLRGNRARYVNAVDLTEFESPFYPPLGQEIAGKFEIHEDLLRKGSDRPLLVHETLETNILSFEIFPGIPFELLTYALKNPQQIKGVILKTFGSEFSLIEPTQVNEEFLNVIKFAQGKGIMVVNITSHSAEILEEKLHEVNAELLRKGAISGLDMTPEAALCKLMYLLGSKRFTKEVAAYMQIDHRGEQSLQIHNVDFGVGDAGRRKTVEAKIPGQLEIDRIYKAIFRLRELQFPMAEEGAICTLKVFLNLPDANDDTSTDIQHCVKVHSMEWKGEPIDINFDALGPVKSVVNPEFPIFATVLGNQERMTWGQMKVEIYARTQDIAR